MKPTNRMARKVGKKLRKMAPTILSCMSAVGVVTTAVLAIRATPKALKQIESAQEAKNAQNGENLTRMETIAACWTCYGSTAITGIATIGCIFGANALNRRQQASLVSAYALLSRQYRDYTGKVRELYGKEAHEQVLRSIAAERVDPNHIIQSQGLMGYSCLDFEDADEEERLFCDEFSGRYFTSTISKVLQAEYHLNRNFMMAGALPVNEFYRMLGIDEIEDGEYKGWNGCDGDLYWIDFNHTKTVMDDGLEVYIISFVFDPELNYDKDL